MPYKVSFQNRQSADRNAGYSENFYNSATSDSQLTPRITALANALFNLKGFGGNIDAARVSQVDLFRAVYLVPLGLNSDPHGSPYDADALTTKLQIKLSGDNPKQAVTQWIGSIPDNSISQGGRYQPTSNFVANFNAFKSVLTGGNGWTMRKLDPASTKKPVASITQQGVVTTAAAHGLEGNPLVRLGRVKNLPVVNGIYRINVLTPTTLQLIGFEDPGEPITIRASTYIQAQTYTFIGITNVTPIRCSSHKVGRPFNLSSGRRPNRVR